MKATTLLSKEETLDPEDWQTLRELGHRMVDDMLMYLETVRERPVWQPIPDEVKLHLRQPLPRQPEPEEKIYEEFLQYVLPYPTGNIHPRFWGWVMGTGLPFAALAEFLAATMNPNVGGGEQMGTYVELQVLDWCKQMLGYPATASGLLVSGGSMANLVGLTVARNANAGFDVRRAGVGAAPRPLVAYASREVHSSVQKAIELLGLGSDALRKIPVNSEFQIDLEVLQQVIAQDRATGNRPFCVIGCAGTVNTGAIDDLDALAEICERENLWLHVDGAFGALTALSPSQRHLVAGLERADSLAFDLHKWMYLPFEVGCVLIRDEHEHRRAFSLTPDYLAHTDGRGIAGSAVWLSDYGVQLSRGFRALKVWMCLKQHGIEKFGRVIEQNIEQAQYLVGLVRAEAELELLAPVPLNIVCFRFRTDGFDEAALDALNKELLIRLHESGVAAPSYTMLDGKYALRVAITNHRSRRDDFDLLVAHMLEIGRGLASDARRHASEKAETAS